MGNVTENDATSKIEIHSSIQTLSLGVYRVLIEKRSSLINLNAAYRKWTAEYHVLLRFVKESYQIAPVLMVLYTLLEMGTSVDSVVFLVFETRIFRNIELGIKTGAMDTQALLWDLVLRAAFLVLSALVTQWREQIRMSFKSHIVHHLNTYILMARLKSDLPTLDANLSDDHINAEAAWFGLQTMVLFFAEVSAIFAQLAFILRIARSNQHGLVYAILCIGKPFLYVFLRRSLWSMPHVVEAVNPNFLRMRALMELGKKDFRLDVISSDIVQYIVQEYRKARELLGNTPIASAATLHHNSRSSGSAIAVSFTGELPMMYCVAIAFFTPHSISLATIVLLQESSSSLKWSFRTMVDHFEDIRKKISMLEQLFDLEKRGRSIEDGNLSYPLPDNKYSSKRGMQIELRNICFTYPGAQSTQKALSDVSFTLEAGSLVVIVGTNGCGKSTILKLLTRLYNPDSGTILIDGEDIRKYSMADLRQAMATLTQDHRLFPVSISENIGLGFSDKVNDEAMIKDAAEKGGAIQLIERLDQKMKTVLEPKTLQYGVHVSVGDGTLLGKEFHTLRKSANVSGGERQRLVASRTFMRLNSGKVRLVAVDEPSSALDPEGEQELFKNFLAVRQRDGCTMICVTHRFGDLTKRADQIICLKGGEVVESGTHAELMALNKEYLKMYNIQARAFESNF